MARAVIEDPEHSTVMDESGAVRSVQAARLIMPSEELERIWSPMHLERLARTYWRFLTRVTLGVIRVKYTEEERTVCVLFRAFPLLRFQKPEYEMNDERGVVRWRIEDGVLVSSRGRGGDGFLQIDMARTGSVTDEPGCEALEVEVEVANFYPSLASRISSWFYTATQGRIHVFVTHGFLRSLARLDLAESRVGRFARRRRAIDVDDVPDPPPIGERSPAGERPYREP
ncbi:MAG: hypothetical protein QOK31_1722, partial [Solirubrobacteraceae bacterium]|nr:hypothetical protein [Solirubrobacteraceae bacterium]